MIISISEIGTELDPLMILKNKSIIDELPHKKQETATIIDAYPTNLELDIRIFQVETLNLQLCQHISLNPMKVFVDGEESIRFNVDIHSNCPISLLR